MCFEIERLRDVDDLHPTTPPPPPSTTSPQENISAHPFLICDPRSPVKATNDSHGVCIWFTKREYTFFPPTALDTSLLGRFKHFANARPSTNPREERIDTPPLNTASFGYSMPSECMTRNLGTCERGKMRDLSALQSSVHDQELLTAHSFHRESPSARRPATQFPSRAGPANSPAKMQYGHVRAFL